MIRKMFIININDNSSGKDMETCCIDPFYIKGITYGTEIFLSYLTLEK